MSLCAITLYLYFSLLLTDYCTEDPSRLESAVAERVASLLM